jgi:hypothetical protein
MRPVALIVTALAFASGCSRTVVAVARVPALIPEARSVETVAVGPFRPEADTPPGRAEAAAAMLVAEFRAHQRPRLALPDENAQLRIVGSVLCRIDTDATTRPGGGEPVRTRSAEVAVTFDATTGRGMHLFRVTERPTVEDKRAIRKRTPAGELPAPDTLANALLRATVQRFVEDVSPREIRVRLPRPIRFTARRATRRGIDLLGTDLAGAVSLLERAVTEHKEDAAAFNALGFCAEVTGNLEAAVANYTWAVAVAEVDSHRKIFRENLQRAHRRLQHRRALLGEENEKEMPAPDTESRTPARRTAPAAARTSRP